MAGDDDESMDETDISLWGEKVDIVYPVEDLRGASRAIADAPDDLYCGHELAQGTRLA